jgi:hypothetical protein
VVFGFTSSGSQKARRRMAFMSETMEIEFQRPKRSAR